MQFLPAEQAAPGSAHGHVHGHVQYTYSGVYTLLPFTAGNCLLQLTPCQTATEGEENTSKTTFNRAHSFPPPPKHCQTVGGIQEPETQGVQAPGIVNHCSETSYLNAMGNSVIHRDENKQADTSPAARQGGFVSKEDAAGWHWLRAGSHRLAKRDGVARFSL